MDKQTFYDNVQDYLNSSEKLYGSGKNTATVDPQQLASAVEQAVGSRVDTAARDSLQKAKEYTDQEIKKIPPSTGGGAGTPGPKGDPGERGERGEQGPAGQTGPKGADGQTPTVRIASVTTGEPGTQATVENTGSGTDVALSFTIPRGPKGEPGIQGVAGERGADGVAGAAGKDAVQPTFSVGQVNTLEPGQQAAVRISGTPTAPVLEFDLPRGERGLRGETGAAGGGAGGTAIVPNIEFQTKTVEHTVAASVEKSGSNENPVFTLSVPKGVPGPKGEDGQDGVAGEKGADGVTPVITINAQAVEHDQPASVQKSGSDTAPTFTLSIPKGEPGVQGPQGPRGERGADGANGERGEQGPAGANGPRGEVGATPVISASVEMIESSAQASVEKSGTDNAPSFVFKIPRPAVEDNTAGTAEGLVRLPKYNPSAPEINYSTVKPQDRWGNGVEVDHWGRPVDAPVEFVSGRGTFSASPSSDPQANASDADLVLKSNGSLKSSTTFLSEGYFRFSPDQQYNEYGEYYIQRYFKNAVRANGGRATTGNVPLDTEFNKFQFTNTISDGLLAAEWWLTGVSNSSNVNCLLFNTSVRQLDLFFQNDETEEVYPSVTIAALRVCRHGLLPSPIAKTTSSDFASRTSGVMVVMMSNGTDVSVTAVNRRSTQVRVDANTPVLSHNKNDLVAKMAVCKTISAPNGNWKNDSTNYDIQVVTTRQQVSITKAGTAVGLMIPPNSVMSMRF